MKAESVEWVMDPADPRAPTLEVWARMSEAEREWVVATLPESPAPLQTNPPGRKEPFIRDSCSHV